MQPDLVCKITVRTPDGKQWRGSGYPITPNRIITAAHVVADAAYQEDSAPPDGARQITLTFGSQETPFDGPVALAWCGTDVGVDVAVLRCQLPIALQPAHALLLAPPPTPIDWHAQGYTDFGATKRPGGKDAYEGTLPQFSATEATVALGCTDGLVTSKQWAGGSGSVAFDRAASQTALAVITRYQRGKKRDQLVAVPLCYLLHADSTRDGFRRAIQFAAYERRRDYYQDVIWAVTTQLQALESKILQRVAHAINAVLPQGTAPLNVKSPDPEALAAAIVSHAAVTDVVARLVGLMEALVPEVAEHVAQIIDHVLPLNYAPRVIQTLQAQLDAEQIGVIDNLVSTRTLAEIIMAGYDLQPARFATLTDGRTDVPGRTALDYSDGPEEGPGQDEAAPLSLLRAAEALMYDLVERLDTLVGLPARPLERTLTPPQHAAELERLIQGYAIKLGGALAGVSKSQNARTVYCVLRLPAEDQPTRTFRHEVLALVRRYVPELLFVELMRTPTDKREFEVGVYVKARVLRTQHRW